MGLASSALKRIRKEVERRSPVDEILGQATDYLSSAGGAVREGYERLDDAAPSLTRAYRAGLRVTPAAPIANLIAPEEAARTPAQAAFKPFQDVRAVGHGTVLEPASFGLNRLTGGDGGSPFSGTEFKSLTERAKAIESPYLRAGARAGLFAAGELTDPTTYLGPVKGASTARTALRILARRGAVGVAAKLGAEAGGELTEHVGLPREVGVLTGGLAAPISASRIGRTPVLSAVDEAGTAATAATARATARSGQLAFPGLDSKAERRSLLGLAGSFLYTARAFLLSGDVSQIGRVGVTGWLQAASAGRPVQGAIAVGKALRAAVQPRYADELLSSPLGQKWRGIAYPADLRHPDVPKTIVEKIPGLSQLERAMFQRYTPVLSTLVSEVVEQGMKGAGDFARMSAAARRVAVGTRVRHLLIGKELSDTEAGTVAKAIARFSLLSPRWTLGQIQNVTGIVDPGPQGELTRRFWTTTLVMAGAASVGLTAAFTKKDPRDLLDPTSPHSVVNPRNGRRFLAVELPDGTLLSPFQPVTPLMRTLLRPPAEGYDVWREDGDVLAAIGAMAGESKQALTQYLLGRASPAVRAVNELVVTNRDFEGLPIVTEGGFGGLRQAGEHLARTNLPILAQPLLEREARVPGTGPTGREQALEMAGSFVGLTVRTPDRLPPDAAEALRETLSGRGVHPGRDSDLLGQYFGLNLDPSEKAKALRDQPALRTYLDERTRLEGERFQRPRGRELIAAYNSDVLALKDARVDALRQLEAAALTGNEYRAARREVMASYSGGLRGLQQAHFGTLDRDRVDAALDAAYRSRGTPSEEEQALDGLYSIQPEGPDPASRDRYFAERRQYLDAVSPDMRQRLLDRQLAEAPTETERGYLRAQVDYDAYSRIPRWRGLSNDRANPAEAVLARARARVQQRPGMTIRRAVFADQGSSAQAKQDALKIDRGVFRSNGSARRRAFARSPLLGAFYRDAVLDEVEDLVTRRPVLAPVAREA